MKLRAMSIILASGLLTACAAVLIAGIATAGLIVYDKRSLVSIEKDTRIYHLLNTAIAKTPRFDNSHIVVTSFNQIVLLVGQTPTASLRVSAEKTAYNIPNVRKVYDEITIGSPSIVSQRAKDSWLTGQIRSQMLTKKRLQSGSIRIITENNTVYLMGTVTHEQANLAVEVARQMNGVEKVVKVFEYI